MNRIRMTIVGAFAAIAMTVAGGGAASAQSNNQSGLVNVFLAPGIIQVPVSVAVPIGVAANVCGIDANVLAQQANSGGASCTATSTSTALNQSIANAMTGQGGGGTSNHQSGLVNVFLAPGTVQVPASVAIPIGVAANVCGIDANVLAQQANSGGAHCTATSTSMALSQAIANAITMV